MANFAARERSYMKATLYIDTSDSQKTVIGIFRDNDKKYFEEKTDLTKSQNLLPLIEKSLKKENFLLKNITEIQVNCGPGSFTGIRVGITVANTLGWVLNVPVNGQKMVLPKYQVSKFD
jgi:tRNA threonylcarbamoyladenosine biosynthesis protein TsaB